MCSLTYDTIASNDNYEFIDDNTVSILDDGEGYTIEVKLVPGEGYAYGVTEEGKVYSFKSKKYIGFENTNGYLCIDTSKGRAYIHKLMIDAFMGPQQEGHEVHHIDKNRQNNSINNLISLSHKEHTELHKAMNIYSIKHGKQALEKKIQDIKNKYNAQDDDWCLQAITELSASI